MSKRPYVGVKGTKRETFKSAVDPTKALMPNYDYVIGPFRTHKGACVMARFGANNPHIQTVGEAEYFAKIWSWEEMGGKGLMGCK